MACITWRKILLIDFLLIALLILATRFATFLHEVFGHALVAVIVGGEVHRITVSLFGGGKVWADLGHCNSLALFFFCLSGIFVNLVAGVLPIVFRKKIGKISPIMGLFWAVFSMTSLLGTLAYIVLGLYYDYGDPVNWVQVTPRWLGLFWVPFLIITPIAAYVALRLYVTVQENVFPENDFVGRLKIAFITLGVSSLIYAGLFIWTNQHLASIDAPIAAYESEKAKIIEKRQEELAQRFREVYPDMTEEEIQSQVDHIPIHVDPDEVATKFPLIPVLVILCTFGGLAAMLKGGIQGVRISGQPRVATIYMVCFLAAVVISVLVYTNGYIFKGNI